MKSRQHIVRFLQLLAEKNYAEANKYMQMAVAEKLKSKIRSAVNTQKLF